MSVSERFVDVAGGRCRILEKGSGDPVGVLAGHNGLPRWTRFLDRLAESHRVILVSPPGFPGSDAQHETLDSHLDWVAATLDLLEASGAVGGDLVAGSVGGILALDIAALSPGSVRRLSLTSPYGIYESESPTCDYFAQTPDRQRELLCLDAGKYEEAFGDPDEPAAAARHELVLYRAATAAARLSWPIGDRGARKRLHRIKAPVQLIWGDQDRIIPPSYGDLFAAGLPNVASRRIIAGSGHLVWIDQPEASAEAVSDFLSADGPLPDVDRPRTPAAVS